MQIDPPSSPALPTPLHSCVSLGTSCFLSPHKRWEMLTQPSVTVLLCPPLHCKMLSMLPLLSSASAPTPTPPPLPCPPVSPHSTVRCLACCLSSPLPLPCPAMTAKQIPQIEQDSGSPDVCSRLSSPLLPSSPPLLLSSSPLLSPHSALLSGSIGSLWPPGALAA